MTPEQQKILMQAASALRLEARSYHDKYKLNADAESKIVRNLAFKAFENHSQLERLARELDIIAEGL